MTTNTRTIAATPDQVWDVLADGWLYPLWVVGASRIRGVTEAWPNAGARIHHSVGTWPILIDDHTEVVESLPGRHLRLRARAWPIGEADVLITLNPDGAKTSVAIDEDVVKGPGAVIPSPITSVGLKWRNVETLRRLAYVVEGRGRETPA